MWKKVFDFCRKYGIFSVLLYGSLIGLVYYSFIYPYIYLKILGLGIIYFLAVEEIPPFIQDISQAMRGRYK